MNKLVVTIVFFEIMIIVGSVTSNAGVRVQRDALRLRVEADRSSTAEVMSAVSSALRIRVRSSVDLDESVTGTYTGSAEEVLSRVLGGYNYYFVKDRGKITGVFVIGTRGSRSVVAEHPKSTPANSFAVRWRGWVDRNVSKREH